MPIQATITTSMGVAATYHVVKAIPILDVDNVEFQRGPATVDIITNQYLNSDAYHNGLKPLDQHIYQTKQMTFVPLPSIYAMLLSDPSSPYYGGSYTSS